MNGHKHKAEHSARLLSGRVIETCDCGASRDVIAGKPGPWHACARCAHAYGLTIRSGT